MSKRRSNLKKKPLSLDTYKFDTANYVKIPSISKKEGNLYPQLHVIKRIIVGCVNCEPFVLEILTTNQS